MANFSDRFTGICAGTKPPGNDPHVVAEAIRKNGVIPEAMLPFSDDLQTIEEYYSFKGADEVACQVEGYRWPYVLKHEWLWNLTIQPDLATKNARITEALRYSPVAVSVSAWYEEDGLYVDKGQPNNHWCVIFNKTLQGWKVFDSYDQSVKTLSFGHNIRMAKRYFLETKTQPNWLYTLPVLKSLLKACETLLALLKKKA